MRLASALVILFVAFASLMPVNAQDGPDCDEETESNDWAYEASFERSTLIGMMVLEAAADEIDEPSERTMDEVADWVVACIAGEMELTGELARASAPDYGDERALIVGTLGDDEYDFEIAILLVRDESRMAILFGVGLTLVLDDFLAVAETVFERDGETAEDWLPTLDDLPTGFIENTDEDE